MVGEQKRRRCKTRHRQRLRAAVLFCVLAAHAHGGQDGGARRTPHLDGCVRRKATKTALMQFSDPAQSTHS